MRQNTLVTGSIGAGAAREGTVLLADNPATLAVLLVDSTLFYMMITLGKSVKVEAWAVKFENDFYPSS